MQHDTAPQHPQTGDILYIPNSGGNCILLGRAPSGLLYLAPEDMLHDPAWHFTLHEHQIPPQIPDDA